MKSYSEITWTELSSKNRISPVRGINAVSTPQAVGYLGVTGKELSAMRAKLSGRLKALGMFTESMKNLFGRIPGAEKLSGFEYVLPLEDGGTIRVSGGPVVYYPAGALALLADAVQERRTVNREAAYNQAKESTAPVGSEMNLVVFSNPEFGNIRAVEIDGEPWLVGKDVAAALDYERTTKAIVDHVDEEDRMMVDGKTQSQFGIELGQRGGWLINESGLYSLILSSKLPDAKKFKRWVTSEVLPSIRKHGGYIAGQEQMSDDELMAKALMVAQNKIAERDRLISELKTKAEIDAPKVAFADAVHDARSDITVEKFAKLLCNKNGVNIGRNNMFFLLRNMGYLRENNMPYQKYLQAGYFTTRELLKNGRLLVQTMITGKGQMLLFDKVIDAVRSSM